MLKKIVALFMVSVMSLSLLAGCGGNSTPSGTGDSSGSSSVTQSTPEESSKTDQSTSSSETTPSGSEETDEFTWEQTWPDGQVIRWLVLDTGATAEYSRYYDLIAISKIEEMFHVDIQFEVIGGNDGEARQAQYLLKLTSDPLPDVIAYQNEEAYTGGITGLYADGICQELNDIIDTKMPHLKKILEDYPDVAKDLANNDGQYLYLEKINPFETQADKMSTTTTGLILRQDWLDNVGMDVPTSIEEWYDVLTAFKTMDPNNNGLQDEIPFDASSSGLALFEGAFAMYKGIYIDPDTGKVEYGARTQKYKDYLEEMNKWYNEGLIGNAYYEDGKIVGAGDTGGSDETIVADLAGSWKGLSNADGKWTPILVEKNPDAALVAAPWPTAPDGESYSTTVLSRKQRDTELISTDCQGVVLDAVATVMDYMLSEEGSLLLNWGEEGVTFEYDENGNRKLTEAGNEVIELPNGGTPQRYKMYGNQSGYFPSFGCFDVNSATRDEWYNNSSIIWADASFALNYPGTISLSPEQSEKVNDDNSELGTYIEEMSWKFITGQEPLSNFDTYVSNLERLGISDVVAVYQEAYDAYMAR